ncbi:alpha/beta fold hydrolase [Luteipulveratus halotolerans]|uniref:Alpha/beta hydrolase n=1 Tax=Luteipulveratus halotolerans TaxID=1631356 RepID=A0A0L6CEU1_9MICO|nr:alpha/beta hydrolase [Luteipulveratus halotolerans]KNX36332.1 alpha/beta hydrolase [Luteipulveratus halotolerans]
MEVLRTHGVEVAYERVGSGPLVLLVHGSACDSRIWRPQLDALADDLTVVAWDQPGAGRSSDPPPGFTLSDYAACLADLVDHLALGPAHVVGHSWGSTLALELYRQAPEQVATLVLVDAYAGWKGSLPASEVRARVERTRAMLAAPPAENVELPGVFAGEPPAEFAELVRRLAADVRRGPMADQLTAMAEADLGGMLGSIDVPTLLLWGELDARSPLTVARRMEAAIPGARLVTFAGAGHTLNLERPAELNDAVREFVHAHPG